MNALKQTDLRFLYFNSPAKKVAHFWIEQVVDGFHFRDLPFLNDSKHFTSKSPSGTNAGTSPEDNLHYSHHMTRELPESYQIIQDIFVSPNEESSSSSSIEESSTKYV
jgi:hypothetical protein